ncbi:MULTISPECIES: class I SAM-dependent methyltransferase [unclassified Crossiella]|uniref:class I SAM-dependent methyltransferase n=1 Tax=unclassified Crossiella TaxID=2620835 RepID=UPI001FFE6F23|nr:MULTISPECIES: class I SAM-dependent methyltransferase [unclassified Crossiella]MCK2239692.1 class I SAM-dependent methyltransferase [Crossiella sp. S99.2]MCK2252387.1 class I SAM-dependent methyltransferase [Crossiella sp. S99.1]
MAAPAEDRHATAERVLGTSKVVKRRVDAAESRVASRVWWDADADDYQAEHADFLGAAEFVWCPEGLLERDLGLLGEVKGQRILEMGCGMAACARWLAAQGALAVGLDVSAGMLRHARQAGLDCGTPVPLVQASGDQLPFADNAFDTVCSAFGAVPFVADLGLLLREVHRVLKPGGRWVFAVTHPMRWIFPDDPGEAGLTAMQSYFDRTPYLEVDEDGNPTYVEHHRTLGDYIRELNLAGLVLEELLEPEWPEGHTREWGQWSPLRGELFPGTAIFCCHKAGQ